MKTPEDIKKAMACHANPRGFCLPCSDCSYHGRYFPPCRIAAHEDALTYIKYLEERVTKQNALLALMGITIPEEKSNEDT